MYRHKPCVHSNFQFVWEIKNFVRSIRTSAFDIDNPLFNLKCIEVTSWSLELLPVFFENDYEVSCLLTRLSASDELYNLSLSLIITVEDETGSLHFQKRLPFITVGNKDGFEDVFIHNLIESKRDLKNVHYPGSIFLYFDFHVSANPIQTFNFNCSPGLKELSTDMERLYLNKDLKEATITAKNTLFFVHLAVLHARWPDFSEYLEQFPNLIIKKDLQDYYSIQLEILIRAAVKDSLDDDSTEILWEEEVRKITDILTAEMLSYLLYYTYTGRYGDVKDDTKANFVKLCRCFQFQRLLKKYQETPVVTMYYSKAPQCCYSLEWSQEDGKFWESTDFQPFVQIIESHKQNSGLLELKFIIQDDDFIINFKNLEKGRPISLSCAIKLKHENGFTYELIFNSIRVGFNNEIWPVNSGITKTDVPSTSFTINVTFHYYYESQCVKNEFDLTPEETVLNQSLHHYSLDFLEFYSYDIMPDMTIIAKGKKLDVHKYILCARSSRFRSELRQKLPRDYKFMHLVSGINLKILDDMLVYMYSGTVKMNEIEDVNELLKAAKRYKLKHLIRKCENYLARKPAKNNEGK